MAEFDAKTRGIVRRLQTARVKLLNEQPFYAVLLMNIKFALDDSTPTLYTDGERIAFSPDYIEDLSDIELQFVLMHEILHVALGHCALDDEKYDHELFNMACDIVVNSNILYSFGMKKQYITIDGEEMPHKIGKEEGYLHTVQEIYDIIMQKKLKIEDFFGKGDEGKSGDGFDSDSDSEGDGEGESESNGKGKGKGKGKGNVNNRSLQFDDHSFWEGDVGGSEEQRENQAKWTERMINATEIAEKLAEVYSSKHGSNGCCKAPLGAQRVIDELLDSQIDWRTILENFIQEEVNDYSFSPPDRRFEDSPFFLPDFNEKDESVKNIVFLVDTSGSMSNAMIQAAYSEIKGAIDQFDGKLEGYVVAADTQAYELVPFGGETDISKLIPHGGGGTDFEEPIKFVLEKMKDDLPCSMIYITDGYCNFPYESITLGIPFLWLLTTKEVEPPWGRVARITEQSIK